MRYGSVFGLILCIVASVAIGEARVYHVSLDGDDENSGAFSEPVGTIQRAADLARAGDTVLVRAGIYREAVVMRFSGEPGRPIVLENYPGENPVIQPGEPGEEPPGHGVLFQAREGYKNPIGWIVVEGFEIRYGWDGVKLYNAHDVEIRRCRIHDNFNQGILGNGNRVLIDGNVIAGNGTNLKERDNQQHGIYGTGTAFTITNNIIHSNRAYGVQVAAYGWREGYAGQEYSGARDWLIANNVFAFSRHRAGIVIWMSLTRNCVVQNNIFYENGGVNGVMFLSQQGKKHLVRNNIFYPPGGSLVSWEEDAYQAVDNLEVDPGFVDPESFDFRLQGDSPAIDAGISDRSPGFDFTGMPRSKGAEVDIGAYELDLEDGALPPAAGKCLYVSARDGDDKADGRSSETAFRTLARAVADLSGGDTLKVLPGEYYVAPLEIRDLDSSVERPVWILGEPRGKAVVSAAWPEAATGKVQWDDEGDSVWSAPHGPVTFGGWRGHFLFRYMSVEDLRAAKVQTRGWYGEVFGPTSGFAWEGERVYVKLPGGRDPNGERIVFSPPFWGEEGTTPVVAVFNSPGLVFDGLRFQASGIFGIKFDPASTHAVVRNCRFEYCRAGLSLPSHSLVEWCEHTYPGFYEFSEEVRKRNGGELRTYPLVKDYQPANWYESGIADYAYGMEEPPVGCEFRYNFLHELFDGEGLGNFDRSESHHNVYLHCYDNSVELEGWQKGFGSRELRFHHNLLLSCPNAPISHQNPEELVGPHYVYRNVIYGYDAHGWNPWTLIKSKAYGKGNGFHYYHNLFWVESAEPYWNEKEWPQEWLETFDFRNNIFVFTKRLKRPTGPQGSEDLFEAGHNIMVAPEADEAILTALLREGGQRLGSADELMLREVENLDFAPRSGSPVVDAGEVIPDFEDPVDGLPDVGPFELGEDPGTDWPRPRRTVFDVNPPARISGKQLPPRLVEFVEEPTGIDDSGSRSRLPLQPTLLGNYPNPFNPETTIRYDVPQAGVVRLRIYDAAGQRVKILVSEHHSPGSYEVSWDGTDEQGSSVSTGMYLTELEAGGFSRMKKMMLVK